jgi:hypothetical protein
MRGNMNRILSLLMFLIGLSSAQIPFQSIAILTPRPYQVGETIRFCEIYTKNIPAESLFVSTNLFSPPAKPAPVLFSGSKSIVINNPDTSWKYLLTHTSEHRDTISFVAYYAPFSKDSIFYIRFKMTGFETKELTFQNADNTLKETTINPVIKTSMQQLSTPYYYNLLGQKFRMESKDKYTLAKKGPVKIGILR